MSLVGPAECRKKGATKIAVLELEDSATVAKDKKNRETGKPVFSADETKSAQLMRETKALKATAESDCVGWQITHTLNS